MYLEKIFLDFVRMNVYDKSPRQTIDLSKTCFYERNSNAPSTCNEPGGKLWQHHIQSWEYWDIKTNTSEIWIEIQYLSLKKMHFKMSWVKSLWPSDAIWWHRSGSTLIQVTAWCHQASSHYLKQCWPNIVGVLWHSHVSSFIGIAQDIEL